MTDETLADDTATTPNEADLDEQGWLAGTRYRPVEVDGKVRFRNIHGEETRKTAPSDSGVIEVRTTEVYPPLEPLPEEVHGTMHVSSDISVPEGVAISQGVSPSLQDETVPENDWDWSQLARPPFILSFVDNDHPNGGFVIGWDTCGACNLHIRTCKCKDGPAQPAYVKRWRSKDDTKHDKPQPISTAGRKALVVADSDEVAAKVAEATADEPVGRKRRADAGVKRGPRKNPNATADSVLEAAGDLAGAMTKEH